MNKHHFIKICAIGLDSSFERILELIFEHNIKGFVLTKENDAQAGIFDFDDLQARKRWENYRRLHPQLPTLILSLNENVPEKDFFVKKPVDLQQFIKTLEKIKHAVSSTYQPHSQEVIDTPVKKEQILKVRSIEQKNISESLKSFEKEKISTLSNYAEYTACGHEPDIDPNDDKAIEKITYERSRRLQGLIEKAVETATHSGCINRLKGTMGELLIDPANRRVLSSVKEQTLNSLMLLPAKNLHIETQLFSPNQAKEYIKNSSAAFSYYRLDSFLWKTAILTSHGRVPIGTDIHAPVVLLRWPNFTRLMITPHALQITALWASAPYSLIETATLLQIPQRYVFSLYTAMVTLNLASITTHISPSKKTLSFSVSLDKRSLFQRLLEKLAF